jgi:hypothetical protein
MSYADFRERCAKIADQWPGAEGFDDDKTDKEIIAVVDVRKRIAAAIRAIDAPLDSVEPQAPDTDGTTVFLKVNFGAPAQAKLDAIQKETRASSSRIFYNMLMAVDTSPLGLRALLPELFPTGETPAAPTFLDANPPAPHRVTIDIYGEEFDFRASAHEARRLIKLMDRVLGARKDVTRLKRQLAAAEAASFNGIGVGTGNVGAGIVVDDPDAGGQTEPE